MRLYSLSRNSAGWRVRIALHLKGVPFEYVSIASLPKGEYRRLNPQGLLPALEVDGVVLAQSAAILEFLEERYPAPPLLPDDPVRRAEVRAFAQLIACDMHPLNNHRVRKYLAAPLNHGEADILDWYRHWNAAGMASLEETLQRRRGTGPFCFGDTPSFADLHLIPQIYNARRFGCDLAPYPTLLAVDAACHEVPAFQDAAPERLPDYTGKEPPWLT